MTPLKLAVLNLSRRKVPTVISVVAIAISVACSGILLRLNRLSENRFATLGRGGDALVGAKAGGIEILLNALNGEGEYPDFLPYKLFESLRAQQSVSFEDGAQEKPNYIRSVIPFVYFAKYNGFRVAGTDESFVNRPESEDSLHFASGVWASSPGEVVVGSYVAEEESLKAGETLAAEVWVGDPNVHRPIQLKVSGVLEPTGTSWDRMLFSSVATAQTALGSVNLGGKSIWGSEVLNYFLVYTQPGGFGPLSSLVNRRTVGQAVYVPAEKRRLENLTGTGKMIGLFVSVLILTLSGLSVTAMLVTRFDAMTLQLAVLRALGYKKKLIGGWLLWEGFLLGLAACALGLLLDLAGFPIMRSLLSETLPPPEMVGSSIFQSAPIWITAILATTASVFIPLYRVYHQDVHFTLRS